MTAILTTHAQNRMRERGIPARLVELVLTYGDVEFSAGSDCRIVRISREAACSLGETLGDTHLARSLPSFAVIDSGKAGRVVTIIRDKRGIDGKRYRRPIQGRPAQYRQRRRPRNSSNEQFYV